MTDRELLQQAMECLLAWEEESSGYGWSKRDQETVDAIRTRLAQPETKVFGWLEMDDISEECFVQLEEKPTWGGYWIPLYTAPQNKEWVGLTDDEIHKIEQECDQKFENYFEFANAIEAKLKEKNT